MAEKQQVPSVGRIVHYIMPDGRHKGAHRPAIIVQVWNGDAPPTLEHCVNLQVFTDGANDDVQNGAPVISRSSVQHRDAHLNEFGTYHFPEYVPAQ